MKFKKFFSNELKVEDIAGNRPQTPSDYETFMETWVHSLHALKDRHCIYNYLLVAITKVITNGNGLSEMPSNASSEIVEAEFKTIITNYPVEQVLDATNKVLDWYKQDDPDTVITIHVKNTVNRLSQENSRNLSFKEQLTLIAEEYRANLNIKENINKIKAKLKEVAIHREFSIYLYKVKPKNSLALGGVDLLNTQFQESTDFDATLSLSSKYIRFEFIPNSYTIRVYDESGEVAKTVAKINNTAKFTIYRKFLQQGGASYGPCASIYTYLEIQGINAASVIGSANNSYMPEGWYEVDSTYDAYFPISYSHASAATFADQGLTVPENYLFNATNTCSSDHMIII